MNSYELSFSDQIIAAFDTGLPLFSFRLKERINEDILKEAVNEALLKHPLYRSRLIFEDGLYKYVDNALEPVIIHSKWDDPVKYGTEKNNYYPWVIIPGEYEINFTAAHSLSDGGGASRFIKSVLVSYLEKTGKQFSSGIDICIDDAERTTEISGEKHRDKDIEALFVPKERKVIDTFPDLYEDDINKLSAFDITIKQSDIKKLSSASETTAFAPLAAILAIAYDKMLDLPEGNIKIEVPFDLRRFWNSISDHNFVSMASLYYDIAKMRGKDINLVQTAFRSQLDIYMDSSNQIDKFNQEFEMKEMLKADPAMLEQMTKGLTDRLFQSKASIVLTYLGNLGYPEELLAEIEDFKLTNGLFPGSMMAAVGFAHNDKITLNMIQATKGNIYIDKLRETMDENNIPYLCEKIEPHGTVTFAVPGK